MMSFDEEEEQMHKGWQVIFEGLYSTLNNKYKQSINKQIQLFRQKKANN